MALTVIRAGQNELITTLQLARAEIDGSRSACKDLIPIARKHGHPEEPVHQRIAHLDALIDRLDGALLSLGAKR